MKVDKELMLNFFMDYKNHMKIQITSPTKMDRRNVMMVIHEETGNNSNDDSNDDKFDDIDPTEFDEVVEDPIE